MMKPLEHAAGAQPASAAVSSGKKESEDTSQEDVDKAAEAFINGFRRDLQLQRTLSDCGYYGYLGRAT